MRLGVQLPRNAQAASANAARALRDLNLRRYRSVVPFTTQSVRPSTVERIGRKARFLRFSRNVERIVNKPRPAPDSGTVAPIICRIWGLPVH